MEDTHTTRQEARLVKAQRFGMLMGLSTMSPADVGSMRATYCHHGVVLRLLDEIERLQAVIAGYQDEQRERNDDWPALARALQGGEL